MATAARLPLAAWRTELCVRTIKFVGIDLTGVDMRAQVRLRPDAPGAPLIALAKVETASAEGLKLDGVTFAAGIPTSTVIFRINKTTMQDPAKVPYGGEAGSDTALAYAIQFAGVTRLVGQFVALASVMDSDGATGGTVSGYSAAGNGQLPWNGAQLTFSDETIQIRIDGADLLVPLAQQATDAAVDSAGFRDEAEHFKILAQEAAANSDAVRVSLEAIDSMFGPGNIFDPAEVTDGAYMVDGVQYSDSTYYLSDFMEVIAGDYVVCDDTLSNSDGAGALQFYSARDPDAYVSNSGTRVLGGVPIAIPAGIKCFRTSGYKPYGLPADVMFVRGQTLPPVFLEYGIPTASAILEAARSRLLPMVNDKSLNRALDGNKLTGTFIASNTTALVSNDAFTTIVAPVTPGGVATLSHRTQYGFFWEDIKGKLYAAAQLSAPYGDVAGGFQLAVPPYAVRLYYAVENFYAVGFQAMDGTVTLGNLNEVTPARLSDVRPWSGRSIVLKNDSRGQEKPWVTLLGQNLGATMFNWSKGSEGMAHALTYRAQSYVDGNGNLVPAVERPMVQADLADKHGILLALGYNSAFFGMPIGSFADGVPTPGSGAAMPTNFIPAMRYAIQTYRAWNNGIFVGVVGVQHRYEGPDDASGLVSDQRERDYRLIEMQVCLEESVPYLDFMVMCGFNKANIASDWPDKVHPTDDAHRRRTEPVIRAYLEQQRLP